MEPPRAQPAITSKPTLQVRASSMFKKVVNIRHKFTGKKGPDSSDSVGPYKRTTRSMDVRGNPFMSQPVLGLDMNDPTPRSPGDNDSSRTNSTDNYSPSRQASPISNWAQGATLGQGPVRMHKSTSVPAKPRPSNINVDGMPTAGDQVLGRLWTPKGVPDIIVSGSRRTSMELAKATSPPSGSQQTTPKATMNHIPEVPPPIPVPTTVPTSQNTPTPNPTIPTTPSTPPNQQRPALGSPTSSVSSRRTSVPRLTNMPPSAFRISHDGSARLSPSIITRPSPMPILNLPTFPLPAPSSSSSSSNQNDSNGRPRRPQAQARLLSMPALSLDGTNELNRESDHDNTGMDSDEEDEEDMEDEPSPRGQEQGGGSDDEDGDDLAPSRPSQSSWRPLPAGAATPKVVGLPSIDMTPMDLDLGFIFNRTPMVGDKTPVAASQSYGDYFSSKPQPGPSKATPAPGRSVPMPSTPAAGASSRPSLYHQMSKSMVDITSPKNEVTPDLIAKKSLKKGKMPAQAGGADINAPTPAYTPHETASGLRRQRSMPIFKDNSDPPPYPAFAMASRPREAGPNIQPRDDEGKETLPCYSNAIHLVAIMPRKMEFTAPGVQAKDRKWRRALCELQGTAFRVYKCPPGLAGGGVIGEWWEKKVGVGDATTSNAPAAGPSIKFDNRGVVVEGGSGTTMETPKKLTEDARSNSNSSVSSDPERRTTTTQGGLLAPPPPQQQQPQNESTTTVHLSKPSKPMRLASNLLHPITRGGSSPATMRSHSRSRSDVLAAENEPVPRSSLNISRGVTRSSSNLNSSFVSSSGSGSVSPNLPSSSTSPPTSASRSSFSLPRPSNRNTRHSSRSSPRAEGLIVPDRADLVKAYSLQGAESGLGNDYVKRKNVIRVRLEGEQFLLQAQDVMDVVEWIEGFHAATNIALDLDERVMPKGPMFPRRRRRRRRPEGTDASARPANLPDRSPQT